MLGLLWRDVWSPIWPNLAASVLWTLPALWWHHSRMRAHVAAEVAKLRNDDRRNP